MRARSRWQLTRRELLGVVPGALVAAACGRSQYLAEDFRLPTRSPVGLFPASYDEDLGDLIYRALEILGPNVRGKRVFLKPNLVEYQAGTAINTHPAVVCGAATAFLRSGAREVVVGEGPGHRRDIEYLLTSTGLYDHLREMRVRFVDLNHDDVQEVRLRSHLAGLNTLWMPVELFASDFIVSIPKLKTHHWAGMTASMKNLFGTVSGAVYGWPKNLLHFRGIDNCIVDLNATVRPHFAIVDAIVGMEGDGPIMGSPRALGVLAIGHDPVAVDATCARLIGLDPRKVLYLETAGRFLGNIDDRKIEQRGEQPSRYQTTFEVLDELKGLRLSS